jgi:hypothetical protein
MSAEMKATIIGFCLGAVVYGFTVTAFLLGGPQ